MSCSDIHLRYDICNMSRPCLVSKIHFLGIYGWAKPTDYECAFLNLAIYRVFQHLHHRNLIQSTEIY